VRRLNYIRWKLKRWLVLRPRIYWVSKWSVAQQYGGPEEGGWWYDSGVPVWRFSIPVPFVEELSYALCRFLNGREHKRAEREEEYGYTSVLSYRSDHYSYSHSDTFRPQPYPTCRPHYE
jgi:hypothetical protein